MSNPNSKETKIPNVPNLRFKNFCEPLKEMCLEELASTAYRAFAGGPFGSNLKSSDYTSDGIPVIQLSNITEDYLDFASRLIFTSTEKANELKASNAYPNEIIIAKMMPAGRACISTDCFERYVLGSDGIRVSVDSSKADLEYVKAQINSKRIKEYIAQRTSGSTRMRIGIPELKGLPMYVPSICEQKKIGSFLKLLQIRIQTQNKIIEDLKILKNAIQDKINDYFDIRLKLSDVIEEVSIRSTISNQYPVLSSTTKGLFLQSEYFDHQVASADNAGYKIVTKNDIIISPQNLWMGNITFNDRFDFGIVSPSYKIYRALNGIDARIIFAKMTTKKAFYQYSIISEQGASIVRRNLNIESFEQLPINFSKANDKTFIEALSNVELKIRNEIQVLNNFIKQKEYLLENLFI